MADFDWQKFGQAAIKTRTDIGTFLLFAGGGGMADAIWNFAPYAEFYTLAPIAGALAVGAKKLIFDRDPEHAARAAKQPGKRPPK